MSKIRSITVSNFRTIKSLTWVPLPGFNCIIGPGDSGKSTLIEAIEIVLNGRRGSPFTDADFHNIDVEQPIIIDATIGDLPDELKNVEAYGDYHRGFNSETSNIHDEPINGCELAITLRFYVDQSLEPVWRLYSNRTEGAGQERQVRSKHRELIAAMKLGGYSTRHFSWSRQSFLNKLSEQPLDLDTQLIQLSRELRQAFVADESDAVAAVVGRVKNIADDLGVSVGDLTAQLDIKASSIANGSIALHNSDGSPLRQLGTGSTRLLLSGLHKAASTAGTLLVDEAEHGLEPYRISRLLTELGAKDESCSQVFITTHSPHVIRELKSNQLWVLRKAQNDGDDFRHTMTSPGIESQATVRVCAEAFLSKTVIVCEGKTEIGFVRGLDIHLQESLGVSLAAAGAYCADGSGGDQFFTRAKLFKSLGYHAVIFKDSDLGTEHAEKTREARSLGIPVIEWGNGYALEAAIFNYCPEAVIHQLLMIAKEWRGNEKIENALKGFSKGRLNTGVLMFGFQNEMRADLAAVSQGPGNYPSWYKDIHPGERIGREVIGPNLSRFGLHFQDVIRSLFAECGVQLQ